MKRVRLRDALSMIIDSAGWYVGSDNWMEGCMHELAHSVLIGRGILRRNFDDDIDTMKDGWQNRHEIAVMATQLAAFRKLGFKQGIRSASEAVAASMLSNTRINRYETVASCRRAILAYKPNPKYVDRIVEIVRTAEKVLAR